MPMPVSMYERSQKRHAGEQCVPKPAEHDPAPDVGADGLGQSRSPCVEHGACWSPRGSRSAVEDEQRVDDAREREANEDAAVDGVDSAAACREGREPEATAVSWRPPLVADGDAGGEHAATPPKGQQDE